MAMVNQGWTSRFALAGFSMTLSILAVCLSQNAEKVGHEKVPCRKPRQAPEEEGTGSRVAGVWSTWGTWSACSQRCGLGVLERTRVCQSPYQHSPWSQRGELVPPNPYPPQPQEERTGSPYVDRPRDRYPARPTFPLHTERNTNLDLTFHGGTSTLPLHSQAQTPRLPYGVSTPRHTRQEGLLAEESPLAPSRNANRRRDSAPFHGDAQPLPLQPDGRQEFPSRSLPPRPVHNAGVVPLRNRGSAPFPPRESLPLFKPLMPESPLAGPNPAGPHHGTRVDSNRHGRLTSPTPESQAARRSRVREVIKPGKYGYGKVPFALPLHKDSTEGPATRAKRHPGDHASHHLPSPSHPAPKRPRRKVVRSSSGEEALGGVEKGPPDSRLSPWAQRKLRPARLTDGMVRNSLAVGGEEGRSSGMNSKRGIAKRGDRAETPPEARRHEGQEALSEISGGVSIPSGTEQAQEGGSVATNGGPLSQNPSPSQGQLGRHLAHRSSRNQSSDPKPQELAMGSNPWDTPKIPRQLESSSMLVHANHPPRGQTRLRTQRQNEPQAGGGHGRRLAHSLFVEPPVASRPSDPASWLLHRGSPHIIQSHARGQGMPQSRVRPGAEVPHWNLYYPGTETFHCEGESKQHKACRQEPCPPDRPDPRAVQCAAYNDQEFMGRFYQWEPFTDVRGSQRCELNCRPIGYRFYVRHTEKVQDGTPCEASSQDICVAGQCLTPGCDGILGSNRTLDTCGVCGGDHTTCKLVVGNYSDVDVPIGYHRIFEIPAGATRIHVKEMSHSPNYLALRSHNGKSIINGNWAVNPPGSYEAAGTVFVYNRPGNDRQEGESLTADGPTTEPVDVYMIFQQDNPGVSYQFFLSFPHPENPRHELPRTRPEFGALTMVSPNQPLQSPLIPAMRSAPADGRNRIPAGPPVLSSQSGRNRVVPLPAASGSHTGRTPGTLQRNVRVPPLPPPPPLPQHHQDRQHDYFWRRIGNTECSVTCGKGFWQSVYRCIAWASHEEVGDEKCYSIPKPIVQEEVCNTEPCPAYWDTGDWSACSKSCGLGTQHRQVLCRQIYANRSTVVHPQRCGHLEKPNATQACQVHVCSHWEIHTNWSACSVLCGTGHRTRHVHCISNEGVLLRDSDCPSHHRPQTSEACDMGPCIRTWFYSDWSNTCSAECGTGIQRRSVVCLSSDINGEAEENCAGTKPAEMRACSGGPCQRVTRWYSGPWSTCSSDCGTGTQRREIICVSKLGSDFNVTEASDCAHLEKPLSLQPCLGTTCEARWFSTAWSACSRSCVGGVQVREVQCLTQNKTLSNLCPLDHKPAKKRPCNTQPCLPEIDENCQDKYHNCPVIVQARLCAYSYYNAVCCASCSHALERRHAGPSR